MSNVTLIRKYLPEDIWELAAKFDIPEEFLIDTPDLIEMVIRSKSIDTDEEKQNWFNLMPLMNDEQLVKLRQILEKEKEKLKEIEDKYENKKKDIKKKYLLKWQQMWYIKKISQIHDAEERNKSEEELEAEALLDRI